MHGGRQAVSGILVKESTTATSLKLPWGVTDHAITSRNETRDTAESSLATKGIMCAKAIFADGPRIHRRVGHRAYRQIYLFTSTLVAKEPPGTLRNALATVGPGCGPGGGAGARWLDFVFATLLLVLRTGARCWS